MTQDDLVLISAGSPIPDALTLIRRYCGLATGASRELWGYEYFDARPSQAQDEVTPEDLSTTAALNMRFSRECLEGFMSARDIIRAGLAGLPADLSLESAGQAHLERIEDLMKGLCQGEGPFGFRIPDATRAHVSKVLHRKRPRLIPLYDRLVSERYARGLNSKEAGRGVELLRAIRDDMADAGNRDVLARVQESLATELDGRVVPSRLRLFDIAIWMDGSRARSP
jgi:hypothetical protein